MSAPDRLAITALYVPGDREDRFERAISSRADVVILDLEDAVPPDAKDRALAAVLRLLRDDRGVVGYQVRVNRGATDELDALAGLDGVGVRLPKVESGEEVAAAAARTGLPVTALVESARGLEALGEIAAAGPAALALGEADLASELGSSDPRMVDAIRIRLRIAAAAAGLPAPMLSAYPGIRDLDGLAADTARGAALGFLGRTAVHPAQLATIRAAFRPSAEELRRAEEALAALGAARGGVAVTAGGEMVDAAMRQRAERVLALARATAEPTA